MIPYLQVLKAVENDLPDEKGKWQWSLFGKSKGLLTPPGDSGSGAVSGALETVKGWEDGNVVTNDTGLFQFAPVFLRIAVALMLCFLVVSLAVQGMQLAQYGDNPGMRSKTVDNIKRTVLAIGILGGISFIAQLCFGVFTG